MELGRHEAVSSGWTLDEFNAADVKAAAAMLRSCLDVPQWADELLARRPFSTTGSLIAAANRASAALTWAQVAQALDRHPRIGERKTVAVRTASESAWSTSEQAGVQDTQAEDLAEGNRAYERRFGHIFLICASGLSGEQILVDLRERLTNDADTERRIVIDHLRRIAELRLGKAVPE